MSYAPLYQSRPDGIASRLSMTSLEMLSRHPDLFPLTIEQLQAELEKANSFTSVLPPDATEDEQARFETHQNYLEDRRRAINIHLMRAYEDDEDKSRERGEQKRKEREEKAKKLAEEKKLREEREEKDKQVGKKLEDLRRKKFNEEDVGDLYVERRQARQAGGVGPGGRTVEEIDKDIAEKLLGYKDGETKGIHANVVKGVEKPRGGGLMKPPMVEIGSLTEMTLPDIVPIEESSTIGTPETVIHLPKLPVEIPSPKEAISRLVKSKVLFPTVDERV